jgi:hypothetical protein
MTTEQITSTVRVIYQAPNGFISTWVSGIHGKGKKDFWRERFLLYVMRYN